MTKKTLTLELTQYEAIRLWSLLDRAACGLLNEHLDRGDDVPLRWVRDRLARTFELTIDQDIADVVVR